jgi:type I restriction enzyme R subunit
MPVLASEAGSVQFPLVQYASEVGWAVVSDTQALVKRRGEGGLFFYDDLQAALLALNPGLITSDNVNSVINRLESIPNTIDGNREMLEWLRGNKTIYNESEKRHSNVRVIDFENLANNQFYVTYEWAYRNGTKKGNRADVMFLLNGIPVALIENKNPKDLRGMEKACSQLKRYQLETPEMLTAPQVFNITHLIEYFYGVTWNFGRKFIFNWKSDKSESYKQAIQTFFDRRAFVTLIKEWILFFEKDDELKKSILRQHQTRAAVKVVNRCADPNKKTGLIWHTQGSGKTFTLITSARLLLEDKERFAGATVMLIVDRNELEGQLRGWVDRLLGDMANKGIAIAWAERKAKLQELLDSDFRGLIISMIHKFDGINKDSCARDNFFVLIDEAHRTTGGDLGNYLMGALPKATLIGFTGTPIDKTAQGKGTFKVFGKEDENGYLDKYSIRESIEDGTTLKLRHTMPPSSICLPTEILEKEFLSLTEAEGMSDVEELNKVLEKAVTLRNFLKADDRIDKVAQFTAKHFTDSVEPLGYKAFLVAVDREACAKYKEALDRYLPPEYSVPVYTKHAADPIDRPLVAKYQLADDKEEQVRKLFTKADQLPKILIVTDKLLTGYDADVLYTMYLDKPMRDHVLLQAIARVNRPYEDAKGKKKPCGLIIDFVGVLKEMNKALAFDSDSVSGVIEDLELLLSRFKELMSSSVQRYLEPLKGDQDERIEKLLYETFLEPAERDKFTELYKEIETLYEVLSPSPELRDYIDDYNKLAELYLLLRNAYGRKTYFLDEVANKTEMLVRETAQAYGLDRFTRTVEFDEETLQALKESNRPDSAKVINLVRGISAEADVQGAQEPYLISIAERAQAIMDALEERQKSTADAMSQIETLVKEKTEAQAEREKTGLDADTFTVYFHLKKQGLKSPEELGKEINNLFVRFPNYATNSEELRQLKAEIYRSLLKEVSGKQMVEIADQLIRLRRK